MIYTSRYSNPELRSGKYTTVRISVGTPRWKLPYTLDAAIKEIMPFGLFKIQDKSEFTEKYFKKLDRAGMFESIDRQLTELQARGKDIVLLCYEDIRKGPSNWCHRTVFADWWLQQTGEVIPELKDESRFTYEPGYHPEENKTQEEMKLF